ncbi:MAG: ATP-binding protein [Candidatus Zixiibacteriota bacterium]|nr:MAG: ATP-binding protein [candidate division Zixibacteria bacterium]
MKTHEFTYPSVLESEDQMLKDVRTVLDRNAVAGLLKHSFMIVVSEAFTNALRHGNRLDPEKQVNVAVSVNKTEIVADIIDEGRGGLDRVKRKRPSCLMDEGGRGLEIIAHYADSVQFEETEKGGLKVSIKFARTRRKYNKAVARPHGGDHGD